MNLTQFVDHLIEAKRIRCNGKDLRTGSITTRSDAILVVAEHSGVSRSKLYGHLSGKDPITTTTAARKLAETFPVVDMWEVLQEGLV